MRLLVVLRRRTSARRDYRVFKPAVNNIRNMDKFRSCVTHWTQATISAPEIAVEYSRYSTTGWRTTLCTDTGWPPDALMLMSDVVCHGAEQLYEERCVFMLYVFVCIDGLYDNTVVTTKSIRVHYGWEQYRADITWRRAILEVASFPR